MEKVVLFSLVMLCLLTPSYAYDDKIVDSKANLGYKEMPQEFFDTVILTINGEKSDFQNSIGPYLLMIIIALFIVLMLKRLLLK